MPADTSENGFVTVGEGSPALRISRGSRGDGGAQLPVGFAGVEQGADAVVAEAGEPERDSLDDLDEVVRCFGRAVGYVSAMPGRDL